MYEVYVSAIICERDIGRCWIVFVGNFHRDPNPYLQQVTKKVVKYEVFVSANYLRLGYKPKWDSSSCNLCKGS